MKVSVLLGAGASVDAGIPAARAILDRVQDRDDLLSELPGASDVAAFHGLVRFVRAGLEFAAAGRMDPAAVVEIEAVADAIAALAERETYQAAPFVTSWHNTVTRVEEQYLAAQRAAVGIDSREVVEQKLRELGDSTSRDLAASSLSNWITGAAEPKAALGTAFGQLRRELVEAVRRLATIAPSDEHKVDYLKDLFGLVQPPEQLSIATLNYDRSVEIAAERAGITYDTGLGTFNDPELSFRSDAIRILKLHGSAYWARIHYSGQGRDRYYVYTAHENGLEAAKPENDGGSYVDTEPAIIFGGQNKLTAEGPYLDLFNFWRQDVRDSDVLLVVGYSFRDTHVNAAIERYGRRVVVCDMNTAPIQEHSPFAWHSYGAATFVTGAARDKLAEAVTTALSPQ